MTPQQVEAAVNAMAAPVVRIQAPFDSLQAKQLLAPGRNAIQGSALLRQRGGGVVTCAGTPVLLIPATAYARERLAAYYTSTEDGHLLGDAPIVEPNYPAFSQLQRRTTCDPQGHFSFTKLADGEFFVLAVVDWQVGGINQGSSMIQRVALKGGESKEVVLTIQ
jgi:hypothetical protein